MKNSLRPGIDWVGYVDWDVRDFHGYRTGRGSTYNAYLVRDEKTALIDTVKAPYAGTLLGKVAALTDPARIDYLVCNHAEPDHSGSLPRLVEACPRAEVVCDAKCRDALALHYDVSNWKVRVVADGDTLSLGKRSLTFMETPMVHWPESMFTYVPEEKLLFSMDAFGQHFASARRFDDQEPADVVMAEARIYYANIVMPYGRQVARTLERAAQLPLEIVAPSHGLIWRSRIAEIVAAYRDWMICAPAAKVLVLYDTMWQSTAAMARAIVEGSAESDVETRMLNVRATHITDIATESLDAASIAVGSATLNRTLMPQMAAALTYLKGLRPAGKSGFVFGSYGWARGADADMEAYLKDMKFDILREPLMVRHVPREADLETCREAGRLLAGRALEAASTR